MKQLSELRVTAAMDASEYTSGMRDKVAADRAGTNSAQQVAAAQQTLEHRISATSDNVTRMSRRFADGFRATETLERGLRTLGSALDRGAVSIDLVEANLIGMHKQLGLVASEAQLAAVGNEELAQAAARVSLQLAQTEAVADQTAGAMTRLSGTMSLQRQMMFQLVDIGQALPLLLQGNIYGLQNVGFQMAQIGQSYYGNGGMGAALRDAGSLLGRFAVKLAPIGVAAGAAGIALASLTHEFNRNSDVQVSGLDVIVAGWQLLSEKVGEAISPIVGWFAGLWDQISPHIASAIEGVIKFFDLGFRNIRTIWEYLPAAIGDFAITAANNVLGAMEGMINSSRDKINAFINVARFTPFFLGAQPIGPVDFGGGNLENPYAGGQEQLSLQLGLNAAIVNGIDHLGVWGARARENVLAAREQTEENRKATRALSEQEKEAIKLAETLEGTLGRVLGSLFSKPLGDWNALMDTVFGDLAQLGQGNLSSLTTGLFGSTSIRAAANDNAAASPLASAVRAGAREGTAEGALSGLQGFLQRNGSSISAGLGGLGIGYQTQSPLTGALGGALSGFSAMGGNPLGLLIGGIGGLIGGLFGMSKALQEARQKVDDNRMAIEEFIAVASGGAVSGYAKTLADLQGQAAELIRLAEAAQDYGLASRLREASGNARGSLAREYQADITASLNELAGVGYLNKITQAQDLYNQRLRDAVALGVPASGAIEEFNLRIMDIARSSDLTEEQLRLLAARFPSLNSAITGVIEQARLADRLASAQSRVADAQAELRRSYDETRGTLEGNIARLGQFRDGLQDLQNSLRFDSGLSPLSPTERLAEARRLFEGTSQGALAGDATAQGRLQDVARQYLSEARQFYGSGQGYSAIFATVQGSLDQAIASAGGQIGAAQSQLEALNRQTSALIEISTHTKSMVEATRELRDAMDELRALQAQAAAAQINATNNMGDQIKALDDTTRRLVYARAG